MSKSDRASWERQYLTIEENTLPKHVCGNATVVRPEIRRQANCGRMCRASGAIAESPRLNPALTLRLRSGQAGWASFLRASGADWKLKNWRRYACSQKRKAPAPQTHPGRK